MSLTKVNFENNQIDSIPATICDGYLNRLNVRGNPIEYFPCYYTLSYQLQENLVD